MFIPTASAPAGTYTLTLAGTDRRVSTGGTRTTTLTLQVLTPAQAIPNVIATINDLHALGVLNRGQAHSLIVKLEHAITSVLSKPNQPTACNQLQAFVNEVNAYVAAGTPTPAGGDTPLDRPLRARPIMAATPCV